MPYVEFGIINDIKKYIENEYNPKKYNCVSISDDIYMNDWWDRLNLIKTYSHNLNRINFGFDRWGITIIPPSSLSQLQNIVLSDKRIKTDDNLVKLSKLIQTAIDENKYMIHYGV